MNFRILVIIFCITLLIPLLGVTNVEEQAGTTHNIISSMKLSISAPIVITHNDNFSLHTATGNGLLGSPYLLDDLNIDGAGGSGISISNTDDYFIIQNSIIFGSTDAIEGAIKLNNVTKGIIRNNTVRDSSSGFILTGSSNNNTLTNNTAIDNTYGFRLTFSSNQNTLINNTATSNAIGFLLTVSSNNILTNNTASSNNQGFDLGTSSNNNTLINNTAISSNFSGFLLTDFSNNNTLINNTAINGNIHGFFIVNSSYNNLIDNQAISNPIGLYEEGSANNINILMVIPPTSTVTEPVSTITEPALTVTEPASTVTTIEVSISTETSISTLISQIVGTKTTEGFSVIFIGISMFGLILIRRKREN
ncbi:MAG: NosD domain-containing protein [Candidatus Hodarchaeales archaeon]|jgi:parallel beta-helix repeat protein